MILYVNGDSHSAGVGCNGNFGCITDDVRFGNIIKVDGAHPIGEAPHPNNLKFSFGSCLAEKHHWNLVCQAKQGGSVDRAIRTTKQFVYQQLGDIFVLFGIPSIEREEWFHNGAWYQVNAGGHETVPKELQTRYKEWVVSWESGFDYYNRQIEIHEKLVELHEWLNEKNIKHLFFNANQMFQADNRFEEYNWENSFYKPYGDPFCGDTFTQWSKAQGFKCDHWGHFGPDAHQAWANEIEPYILSQIK